MPFRLDSALEILERTPGALDVLLRGLSPEWTRANEGAESWSAFDVVGHLIDGEDTDWIPRVRIILSGAGDGRFEPFDRFRHIERNRGRALEKLLDEFAAKRRANLDALRDFGLQPSDFARTGVHPVFGPVTLEQLLATWVTHDLGHLAQIARVAAKCYQEEVGPWRAYIPILDDRSRS